MMRGQIKAFSLERLMNFLIFLDRDIEIIVKKRQQLRETDRIAVAVC